MANRIPRTAKGGKPRKGAGTPEAGRSVIDKAPTGIQGLDEITQGGLPRGRGTLICGGPGCGKTNLAMEILTHGATHLNEPGLFVSLEEPEAEMLNNFKAIGFDLTDLMRRKKIGIDTIRIERSDFTETGEFDLEGLFIRLAYEIKSLKAKRVVLDTVETLFSGLPNPAIVRAELSRLFRWFKDHEITLIITGERGEATLTRQGLEEYVSDCVIVLDHRIEEQISTRRMRVVKYRGSAHGTNEYPFIIDDRGINVLPITSMGLNYDVSTERIGSGVERLDTMLGGGIYRGSSILLSGTAGSGKSSVCAKFVETACRRGERCMYFAFEESPRQIERNMRSIGINLAPYLRNGLLRIHASRPAFYGLEHHLVNMLRQIDEFDPELVVVDPISNLISIGTEKQANALLLRLVDFLKTRATTSIFSNLTHGGEAMEATQIAISSLMDTWILLRQDEIGGERNRVIYVLKSRGTRHSNQLREFRLHDKGIELIDVYQGPEGVLTGSARLAQESREAAEKTLRRQRSERRHREIERKRKAMDAEVTLIKGKFEAEAADADLVDQQESVLEDERRRVTQSIGRARQADELRNKTK